jgi:hypothetical protein
MSFSSFIILASLWRRPPDRLAAFMAGKVKGSKAHAAVDEEDLTSDVTTGVGAEEEGGANAVGGVADPSGGDPPENVSLLAAKSTAAPNK